MVRRAPAGATAEPRASDAKSCRGRASGLDQARRVPPRLRGGGLRSGPAVRREGAAWGFSGSSRDDRPLDESFPPGDDFLGQLCVAWEAEAHPVVALGSRLVVLRSGGVGS